MRYFLTFIEYLCHVLTFLIFARALLSWIMPEGSNVVTRLLFQITEPLLAPLRKIVPKMGIIDMTPFIAIIILQLIIIFLP